MSDPFDSGTSGISLALDVPFPANVTSGPGVKVDKAAGTWLISLDFPPLVDAGVPANPSTIYLAGYDTGLGIYERLRLDNLISSATGLDSRTPRGDANYTILVGDRYVALTAALTAVRTWTLPAANTVPPGRVVTIQDEGGGISGQFHLLIAPAGADTIDGLPQYRLKAKYGGLAFRSDGTSKWSVAYTWQVTLVADANYTAQQGDLIVAYASISAARTLTLPAANAYPAGQRLTVIDFSGSCSGVNSIGITRVSTDTINGATSQTITQAYGYLALISDGASKWTIVDNSTAPALGAIDNTPIGATTPSTGAFTTLSATGATTLAGVSATTVTATGAATLAAASATALSASTSLTAPNLVINSGGLKVSGRLTLTTGVPVLTSVVTAGTTVYFTPYEGNLVPLWNGTQFVWTPCAEISNILANSAVGNAGPAAAAASQVYDLYVWSNAGVATLTRSPPWSAGTGGSNVVRGTGAGGTALTRVNGLLVNAVAISNGPGAGAGTYVGTIATDSGGGTVSWTRGSSATGGGAAILGVWNMYNRVNVVATVVDSGAAYTYTSLTARAARASNSNRCTFVLGQAEDGVMAAYSQTAVPVAVVAAFVLCGIAFDATNTLSLPIGTFASQTASSTVTGSIAVTSGLQNALGLHFAQATEASDSVNANTFNSQLGATLVTTLRM